MTLRTMITPEPVSKHGHLHIGLSRVLCITHASGMRCSLGHAPIQYHLICAHMPCQYPCLTNSHFCYSVHLNPSHYVHSVQGLSTVQLKCNVQPRVKFPFWAKPTLEIAPLWLAAVSSNSRLLFTGRTTRLILTHPATHFCETDFPPVCPPAFSLFVRALMG